MDVKLTKKPRPIVTVSGEVDFGNAHRVQAAIKQASDSGRDTILDFSGVTYLDSAGANLIFIACRLASRHNGRVVLVIKDKNVRRMLEILGVDVLPNSVLVEERDSAIKALGTNN